jgi:hypothetical protein
MVGFIYEDFIPMAILRADEEDSNNPQGMNQPNTNSTGSQPQSQPISGSSAPDTQASAPVNSAQQSANSPSANPKASSGTFTNLRQYINANQGNKVASAVGQKVSNTATGAQKSIEQGQASFGQKVEQGSLANRENAVSDIKSIVQKARGTSAQPQTAPSPSAQPQAAPNTINPVPVVAPAAAPDYTQGLDTQRFQDVINAQYKGPESLRSSGLYDPISQKVQTAQTKINQAQTASGREDLLKDTFSQNRQYNRGQNKLDSLLLNTSKEGVQGLLDQRAKAGNLQQALQSAENTSSNLATNRASEIKGLQAQARESFTGEQKAEREATDARLASVVQDWDKLPEYFKEVLRNNPAGAVNLGSQEAGILGIKSGEGLYNLGENAIKTAVSDKERLVSRDEQARQFALAQLAGLDTSKMLDTNVKYSDLAKAGTQTAADALDLAGTRAALNEAEKNFREQAMSQNIVGTGSKKNKTSGKRYYSQAEANLGDVFKNAGYNFDAPLEAQVGNADLLRGAGASTSMSRDEDLTTLTSPYASSSVAGQAQTLQNDLGSFGLNPLLRQAGLNQVDGANLPLDMATMGATNILRNSGLDIPGVTNLNIGRLLGGGSNSKESKSIASSLAQADLKNKLQQAITESGFQNRASVADTEQTRSRSEALRAMLAKMDKTNA